MDPGVMSERCIAQQSIVDGISQNIQAASSTNLGVLPPGVTPPPGYPPPPALGVAALPDARGVPDPPPKPEDRGVTDGPGWDALC